MIDSTNPRILANNIRKLFAMVKAIVPGTVVEGNPTGTGYNTLLSKIKIGSSKYKLPAEVVANPEGETAGELSKLKIGDTAFSVEGVHFISGTVTTTTAQSAHASITFDSALPTSDYCICAYLSGGGNGWADYAWQIENKTDEGFGLYWYNSSTHTAATINYFVIY